MVEAFLTPAARRHISLLLGAVAPAAGNLDNRFAAFLGGRKASGEARTRIHALAALTPAAASRFRSLRPFLRQVERSGRWLAARNVPVAEVNAALDQFDVLLEGRLRGQFAPAREQLRLATVLALNKAYYETRESEALALQHEVRRLAAEARRAEEEERRRIGRELHDEAGQSLLFLRLALELMERDAPDAMASRLREAREVVERTVRELRRIVAALSPEALERLGLPAALRHLAGRFRKNFPGGLRLRIENPPERLSRHAEEAIYRAAQECLSNAARHSGATRVNLGLRMADRKTRLRVTDNGAGFLADGANRQPMSFGLAGMKERAALLGGTVAIRSAPGKGASILLELPREADPGARNVEDTRISD